jgi:small ligand-binding sensory domain FIST
VLETAFVEAIAAVPHHLAAAQPALLALKLAHLFAQDVDDLFRKVLEALAVELLVVLLFGLFL